MEYIQITEKIFLNPVFTIADIIAAVTLVGIIVGGIFALYKWSWSIKQKIIII